MSSLGGLGECVEGELVVVGMGDSWGSISPFTAFLKTCSHLCRARTAHTAERRGRGERGERGRGEGERREAVEEGERGEGERGRGGEGRGEGERGGGEEGGSEGGGEGRGEGERGRGGRQCKQEIAITLILKGRIKDGRPRH